ncbi:M16 family metallopeptidase [Pseudaquabacterium pictum]|uniref:Peptidase M16 n=1 Tax=Pseudaquabacterium pictum TaxID=2315236 RepID=A0A480AXA4_9BURK|nr:pitrilysin family protein [Rubrivivax pictus]GCL64435.1 peptidase M16 [Rubrivivax pictus]
MNLLPRSSRRLLAAGLLLSALASTSLLAPAWAQALPAGLQQVTQVEGITEYRLPNGLQVLLVPDATKPSTTVNLTYRVGSRHENYGETGMAHLLEHLIFKGTPTQKNLMGEFGRRGLRFNGTTWYDRTNYFASFTANDENLRWYLAWQADAMVNSLIARSDLDSEMTVVRNEMEAGENNPVRATLQQTMAAMYQWHNYGKSTIGARADVENVDIGRLQAFYRLHYQPDNATLVVAGRFDPAQVLGWVAQSFGPIPKPARVLPPTYTIDPAQNGERTVAVRRRGGAPFLLAAWHGVPAAHPDYAAVEAVVAMLGTAPSGRLHKRVVEQKLAASSFGFSFGLAEPGPLLLGLQLAPGQDVDQARQAMLATVDGLATEPFTAEELSRARTQWLNDWAQGFSDPERVGVALSEAIGNGDWRLYFLARDRMRALQLADVNRVAQSLLVADNRTIGTYLPTDNPKRAPDPALVQVAPMLQGYKGDAAVAQAEAFDATPANLDARTQLSTLPSGLKVALLPKGTRGATVQARLVLRFGDVDSLRGRGMAVSMVGGLIDKGGAGMTRAQISDAFDKLQAEVAFGASGQTLTVGITTVRQHLPAVVSLVGKLLKEPAFPADALDEQRRQLLAGIAAQRAEPGAVASNAAQRHGNPYPRGDLRHAPSFDELVVDANALTVDTVRAAHRRFLSAATGEFGAAGDMDAEAVRTALAQAFGDWRAPADGPLAYVRAPQPLVVPPPLRQKLATPDKPNANLVLVQPVALNDTHPDYPALLVANHLLGGYTGSRLWVRVREQGGLSYDVRSGLQWNNHELASRWQASAIFAPQNQPKVEAAFQEVVTGTLKDGFTQKELDEGRTGLLNQRRLGRAQDPVVAGALVGNLDLGRRFALQQATDDAIAALTLDQVNAALRRHIDPAKWVVVWAGDFKN